MIIAIEYRNDQPDGDGWYWTTLATDGYPAHGWLGPFTTEQAARANVDENAEPRQIAG